jgi:hypothetical protein
MLVSRLFLRGALAALVAGACFIDRGFAGEAGPAKVEVRHADGRWQLLVNNKPFFVKGAGLDGGDLATVAAHGGNSIRTWSTENAREVLDAAARNGLYVAMGLDVARERHGFDYSDPAAVARQLAAIKAQVLQLRHHPALLLWDVGNELNLDSHNPKVWNAVNDISKMIHQVDPNHPTTTALAGLNADLAKEIKTRAPDLDLLSIQMYADLVNLPARLRESGWAGPYLVTEWGATGHWEVGQTKWGAPLEDNSSAKADNYRRRYEAAIASDPKQCLGSYVFLWGHKQERTPTWYGIFLESGAETETVDVMQFLWTGQWPRDRAPRLLDFRLDGKSAQDNVRLNSGQKYPAEMQVQSSAGGTVAYSWEIMQESGARSVGGDREARPQLLPGLVSAGAGGTAEVQAPTSPGAYRFFGYATDKSGKAAYANIPFYVDSKVAKAGTP